MMESSDTKLQDKIKENKIKEAEKSKSYGVKTLVGGSIVIAIWLICFFAMRINIIYFIALGPICVLIGCCMIVSSNRKIEESKSSHNNEPQ
jgi:hypothetical protein